MIENPVAPRENIPSLLLAHIGRAVYGSYWQNPVALFLKAPDRTMRRWINDGCPAEVGDRLLELLAERATVVAKARAELVECLDASKQDFSVDHKPKEAAK